MLKLTESIISKATVIDVTPPLFTTQNSSKYVGVVFLVVLQKLYELATTSGIARQNIQKEPLINSLET